MNHSERKISCNPACAIDAAVHLLGSLGTLDAPYPSEYEKEVFARDRSPLLIRPIKPEDAPIFKEFFHCLSQETVYLRFLRYLKSLSEEWLNRLTRIDYSHNVAMVAVEDSDSGERILGACHILRQPGSFKAEVGVVVGDAWQGRGIGTLLLGQSIDVAKHLGIRTLWALVATQNRNVLSLARKFGFSVGWHTELEALELEMTLDPSH